MGYAQRAVFFLEEESSTPAHPKPLMLEAVLFCPILTWMSEKLKADGERRFFVVCSASYAQEVRSCFAPEDDVIVSDDQTALKAFLEEDGPVAVFPCAALPLSAEGDHYAYVAEADALRLGWYQDIGLHAIPGTEMLEEFTAVYSLMDLQMRQLDCRDEVVRGHIMRGVRFLDPAAVYIDPRVTIGRGSVILPGTMLQGRTVIGEGCTIGPNAVIRDCVIGDGTTVNASQMSESTVGCRTSVGPFAYIRPNCHIGDEIRVGDFVEVKNSNIGNGTKISHLTYVGDSDVGEGVNFGCGTVTTNYDGFKKYRCTIGSHAFLGCNTNLIAPVQVGEGAYTAAGSTITEEVPPDALGIARAQQTNLEGWAARRRKFHGQK